MEKETQLSKIVYAGNRDISVRVLKYILEQGVRPLALMIPDSDKSTNAQELCSLCSYLDDSHILRGSRFRQVPGVRLLKELKPDYIICVHFPYIVPGEVLEIPRRGVLNLHPAYLPYNRGWHTPTWAIWEETPYGATLHFMDEGVDTGDIVHQKRMEILPEDTADTLYQRVMKLELEVFREAWASLLSGTYQRKPQSLNEGSTHRKNDIASIQSLNLEEPGNSGDLIRRLRALTTNDVKESAFFEADGNKYYLQIRIMKEKDKD